MDSKPAFIWEVVFQGLHIGTGGCVMFGGCNAAMREQSRITLGVLGTHLFRKFREKLPFGNAFPGII